MNIFLRMLNIVYFAEGRDEPFPHHLNTVFCRTDEHFPQNVKHCVFCRVGEPLPHHLKHCVFLPKGWKGEPFPHHFHHRGRLLANGEKTRRKKRRKKLTHVSWNSILTCFVLYGKRDSFRSGSGSICTTDYNYGSSKLHWVSTLIWLVCTYLSVNVT